MKVLFVGDLNDGSHSQARRDALLRSGINTVAVNTVPFKYHWGNPYRLKLPFLYRLLFKLGLKYDLAGENLKICRITKLFDPDWIFFDSANAIRPTTLGYIRKISNAKFLYITNDNPKLLHCTSLWMQINFFIIDYLVFMEGYDLHGDFRFSRLKSFPVHRSYISRFLTLGFRDSKKIVNDVIFIGSYEIERAVVLQEIAACGIVIRIYGEGWGSLESASCTRNLEFFPPVYGFDYQRLICQSRITLSFFRVKNHDVSTSRLLEVPAYGGLILSEYSDYAAHLFGNYSSDVLFRDVEDLKQKIHFFLKNEDDAEKIRAGVQERIVSNFSHEAAIKTIMKKIYDC